MSTSKRLSTQRTILLAASGLAALLSFGCSSTHPEALWSDATQTTKESASANNSQVLAAADRLGQIVFGNTSAVAEPKLPTHWTVAKATESH